MKRKWYISLISILLVLLLLLSGCIHKNGLIIEYSTSPDVTDGIEVTVLPESTSTLVPVQTADNTTPQMTEEPGKTTAPAATNKPSTGGTTSRPTVTVINYATLAPNETLPPNAAGAEIKLEDISYIVPSDMRDDYITIKNSLLGFNESVSITKNISYDQVDNEANRLFDIVSLIRYTCPEIFYMGTNYSMLKSYSASQKATFTITFIEMKNYSKSQLIAMKGELDAKISAIINAAKSLSNDFEREVYIHDYIIKNMKYNASASESYIRSIYGGLIKGEGVCEAYARSFQVLMLKLGVETSIITGSIKSNGEKHMWNVIKLYGRYYYVDTTWDDPVPDLDVKAETSKYLISHTYLNQTDAFMQLERSFGNSGDYTPFSGLSCTSIDVNYFKIRNTLANNDSDFVSILKAQKDNFPSGYSKCIEIRITYSATESQIKTSIAKVIKTSYSYSINTTTGIIRILSW